jgi:hypothetical protein
VLISRRHGSSILDVKTVRGPNRDSYHYLVKVKIKHRLATIIRVIKDKRESRQIKASRTVSVISGNNKNKNRSTKNRTDRKSK